MDEYCIYKIRNKINEKVYIGLTKNYVNRIKNHRRAMNFSRNKFHPLYKSIKKHGLNNFEFSIIESNLTKEQAIEKEIYYIKEYYSQNLEFGYNLRGGGELPYHTDESIKRAQNSAYINPGKGKFKGVSKHLNSEPYMAYVSIYGDRMVERGYRTKVEAAWAHDLLVIKHREPGSFLNFPHGKTKEIILEQLISRKSLMNRYTYFGINYQKEKKNWLVRGKDIFNDITFQIATGKTYEECELLLNKFIEKHKPIKEHKHRSNTAKASYEKLYGPIEDLITSEELEIAYKDLGTFSNKHVDSLFPELEGRDWK